MTENSKLTAHDLRAFTGATTRFRHAINRRVLYTEGAQYLAAKGGAYWLLDEIALVQPYEAALRAEPFQHWRLVVHADRSATLTCGDGNGAIVYTQRIERTDFPLDEVALYFVGSTIMLPSEY